MCNFSTKIALFLQGNLCCILGFALPKLILSEEKAKQQSVFFLFAYTRMTIHAA